MARRCLDAAEYTVGWVCALPIELAAAQEMLDEEHESLPTGPNLYTLGRIGSHNVVLECLAAGQMGIGPAAASAARMLSTFKSIRFGLMVGVGGGVPSAVADIRLGDVVISQPFGQHGGVVQYDLGKMERNGRTVRTGFLNAPPKVLLKAVSQLRATQYRNRLELSTYPAFSQLPLFQRDGAGPDVLFEGTYDHNGGTSCEGCSKDRVIHRAARKAGEEVIIHYGTIASGNQVIKDGKTRDRLSAELGGVLCFEMEAAGLMNDFPCLVIRGVCDYADSHKNKTWQPYAAATAAICAKELLSLIPQDVGALGNIPHMPQPQIEHIGSLLLALQGQMAGLSNQLNASQQTFLSRSILADEKSAHAEENSQFTESIERLQSIVYQEGTMCGEQAESLIDDLGIVLHSVSSSASILPKDPHSASSTRKSEVLDGTEDVSSREMKRLCGFVASSHSVALNVGTQRTKVAKMARIFQKRKTKEVIIYGYKITIELTERAFANFQESQTRLTSRSGTVEIITKIRILRSSEAPAVIMAYLHHEQGYSGFNSLIPAISVGKTLPEDSPVFNIVKRGNIDELKRLLIRCQCTLRDRDIYGTPLLHYAMHQPNMCKFLVSHGADIDEVALNAVHRFYQCPPLLQFINLTDIKGEDLSNIIECKRLLLEAGADPTVQMSENIDSLYDAVSVGTFDSLKIILDYGKPFVTVEDKDEGGCTPLQRLAYGFGYGYSISQFEVLIARGANISARDSQGRTSLYIALQHMRGPTRLEEEMEAITFLIQSGADVFAINNLGTSIFDCAYTCDHRQDNIYDSPLGGYRGDLWDAVLTKCGYGKYVRRPEYRRCHYTRLYTHKDFTRLWKGMEGDCPYFSTPSELCPSYSSLNDFKLNMSTRGT